MAETAPDIDDTRMTLSEHLEELRKRLFRALLGLVAAMCITVPCGKYILDALKSPYVNVMTRMAENYPNEGLEPTLAVLTLTGGFIVFFRVSLVAGLILASPWVFYQLWKFIAAGLFPNEKKYVHYAVPFSTGLFIIGAMFFLIIVSNPMFTFFIGFSRWLGLKQVITFDKYVSLVTRMMLVFGVGFQTPLAVLLLTKMGLLSVKTLNRYRKHVIVGILILAALFTSPSPVDQILLALPMWLLYELGVLLAYLLVERKIEPVE